MCDKGQVQSCPPSYLTSFLCDAVPVYLICVGWESLGA